MGLDASADAGTATAAVNVARRLVAVAQAQLAAACMAYADSRAAADRDGRNGPGRPRPGEFACDELAPVLRQQSWHVRCLVARTRRIRSGLPSVWHAFEAGEVDAEQVVMIDRIARRAAEAATLHALDEQAPAAAQTRTARQLGAWLLRMIASLEPDAFAARHRRALADRRVTVAQGGDGIGYVTGEVSALDAAEIDTLLTAAADKPWVEVEDIDPDTGELLGTHRQRVDDDGLPVDGPSEQRAASSGRIAFQRLSRTRRIGIVVPLSSLLGLTDAPGQLIDRSGCVPGEVLRQQIADLLEIDADHHEPIPRGPTNGQNMDPGCRRHHRGKTFAWLASIRDGDTVAWTLPDDTHYRVVDDPLPTG